MSAMTVASFGSKAILRRNPRVFAVVEQTLLIEIIEGRREASWALLDVIRYSKCV